MILKGIKRLSQSIVIGNKNSDMEFGIKGEKQ